MKPNVRVAMRDNTRLGVIHARNYSFVEERVKAGGNKAVIALRS